MNWDRTILEKIDACRVGSDDLTAPEMADVARRMVDDPSLADYVHRVAAFDESVRSQLDQVPIPAGLQDHLLASVCHAEGADAALGADAAPNVMDSMACIPRPARKRWRSLTIAASLVTAACLVVAMTWWIVHLADEPWTIAQMKREAIGWTAQLQDIPWQTTSTSPPGSLAFPLGVRAQPRQWHLLRNPSPGIDVVAVYNLLDTTAGLGRTQAILFVFQADVPDLPATPPIHPAITQGRLVAAWHSGDRICVLVLHDPDPSTLRRFYRAGFTGSVRSA